MSQFYYSRKCGPNPFATKWMVSGVIEAVDLETAKANLDAACARMKSTDRATTFEIINLATVEPVLHGIVALTLGGCEE